MPMSASAEHAGEDTAAEAPLAALSIATAEDIAMSSCCMTSSRPAAAARHSARPPSWARASSTASGTACAKCLLTKRSDTTSMRGCGMAATPAASRAVLTSSLRFGPTQRLSATSAASAGTPAAAVAAAAAAVPAAPLVAAVAVGASQRVGSAAAMSCSTSAGRPSMYAVCCPVSKTSAGWGAAKRCANTSRGACRRRHSSCGLRGAGTVGKSGSGQPRGEARTCRGVRPSQRWRGGVSAVAPTRASCGPRPHVKVLIILHTPHHADNLNWNQVCVKLQLWTAQPTLAEWIRRVQPAHTLPQRLPGAERKVRDQVPSADQNRPVSTRSTTRRVLMVSSRARSTCTDKFTCCSILSCSFRWNTSRCHCLVSLAENPIRSP
eukprot:364189-Chlamydomonas_euryale.AAC.5